MNCFVVTDTNWENVPLILKRLSYLPETIRLNIPYFKNIENIVRVADKLNLNVVRHSLTKNKEYEGIKKCMQYTDFCMVFTDLIEYNNIPQVVIDICENNDIPCYVFTNFTSDYLYMGKIGKSKFKKTIKDLVLKLKPNVLTDTTVIKIENNFITHKKDLELTIEKVKENYSSLKRLRESKTIRLIDP